MPRFRDTYYASYRPMHEALARFACSLRSSAKCCIYTYMPGKTSPFHACRHCSCSALRRASRAVTQHYEACFRGTGLRATQFTLLASLAQTGPLPMSLLASRLGLERTSLTRNLRPLERKGFVETLTDDDRRIRRIKITKRGEAAASTRSAPGNGRNRALAQFCAVQPFAICSLQRMINSACFFA